MAQTARLNMGISCRPAGSQQIPARVTSRRLRGASPRTLRVVNVAAPLRESDVIGVDSSPKVSPAKTTLKLKIDDQWYDCTGWAKAHPGGARFIEFFNGRDATDVFFAIHSYFGINGSSEATDRLAKLPKCDAPEEPVMPDPATAAACSSFREFRQKLEKDGWFEREPLQEAWLLAQVLGLVAAGTVVAGSHPIIATVLISLGMQQAGWLGHDYLHGRGPWCDTMNGLGTLINGHSGYWWSQKHSMHHVFTNQYDMDEDITQEPFFYIEHPEITGAEDHPLRKYQHIYGYPLYSITFLAWRIASVMDVWERKDKKEAAMLVLNYAWLLCLPWQVAIGSVLGSGFLVGAIVSATHQSEGLQYEQGEYVDVQFRSTRDAEAENGFIQWLWGGMDTQLEHHLFPTMPRYKYHKLRPLLKAFADSTGEFEYLISPSTKIISDNWKTLRDGARKVA